MFLDIQSRTAHGAFTERSNRPEVRNPILAYPSAARVREMPAPARDWLIDFLADLRRDAQQRAAKALRTHKAPLYLYHKVVAVWCGHLAKVLRHQAREHGH